MQARSVKKGLFWFLSLGIALFSFVVVAAASVIGFEQAAPHLAHYIGSSDPFLYGHIIFGPLALSLSPFQFWHSLRNRHRLVHRLVGYAYVVSVVVAGVCALLILPRFTGSLWATAGFVILAGLWIGTTVWAINCARMGAYDAHRAWMSRSAGLTFAAVVLRLMILPLTAMGMTLAQTYDITAWLSWLLPLGYVEWRLRSRTRLAAQGLSRA